MIHFALGAISAAVLILSYLSIINNTKEREWSLTEEEKDKARKEAYERCNRATDAVYKIYEETGEIFNQKKVAQGIIRDQILLHPEKKEYLEYVLLYIDKFFEK